MPQLRLALPQDLEALLALTRACANHLCAQGIYQWNAHYPSREAFTADIYRREAYAMLISDQIVGCIVLTNIKDKEYDGVHWLTHSHTKSLYIHRLAVHPEHQGQGLGSTLMNYAEQYALEHGYATVRLDTFSQNKGNLKFYEQRGYKRLGAVYFPQQSGQPFYCYELPNALYRASN